MPTAAFYTLGCKVNQYESHALAAAFADAGFDIVDPAQTADVYIVNSCTVTATGDKKSLQALRRFRAQAPEAVVVLCGCLPQAFPQKMGTVAGADIVMGTKNRAALIDAVREKLAGASGQLVDIQRHGQGDKFERLHTPVDSGRTRAFLKIQDGCERGCAYCIIPAARGPVRSKPPGDIRAELEELSRAGYKEVVLAGVNLSCYGQDLGVTLSDAVEIALKTRDIGRIRLGSLEPDLITREDITRWAQAGGEAQLCPHFHLSLQSGCDNTLGRMNRRYDTRHYKQAVEAFREAFPGCAVTTDIMTGFPGETREDHLESLDFVRQIGFARTHIFTYSVRQGTLAAHLPDRVPRKVAAARAKEMSAVAASSREAFLRTRLGTVYPVLIESVDDAMLGFGHTACYTPVWIRGCPRDMCGEIAPVRLTMLREDGCEGERV